jgi:hypothetical protein
MIDLNRFFENIFYPLETTESNFVEGTDRHIALLTANNPSGAYDAILLKIKTKRDDLKTAISNRDSETTEQEGSTIEMNIALNNFIKFIRIREGLIKSTFEGDNTSQYEEFFPLGLDEYNHATLATIETLLDRCVTKATKYEANLGIAFKNDCIAKRTAFKEARAAQLINIGERGNVVNAAQQAIIDVADQLTYNLHTIVLLNIGVAGAADLYFEQRFFMRPEQSGLYTGENAVNQTKTVRSQGWAADKNIKVTNQGTDAITIGFMNADGVPVTGGQTIAPGTNQTFTAGNLGFNATMHFLNISPAAGSGAKWKVEVS